MAQRALSAMRWPCRSIGNSSLSWILVTIKSIIANITNDVYQYINISIFIYIYIYTNIYILEHINVCIFVDVYMCIYKSCNENNGIVPKSARLQTRKRKLLKKSKKKKKMTSFGETVFQLGRNSYCRMTSLHSLSNRIIYSPRFGVCWRNRTRNGELKK